MTLRVLALPLILAIRVSVAAAGELRVGAAAESITPPAGAPMSGYNSARVVRAVDDDLYAKALVIERDGVCAAMVVCDLITMPRAVVDEARKLIAASPAGIPAEHVMISATHTHTGPLLSPKPAWDPRHNDEEVRRVRAYLDALPVCIASAVQKAHAKLGPARALAGTGHEPRLSFNRRYVMKDGSVGWNPGKLNPDVDRPAGPVDPDVPVVYFESVAADKASPAPLATYVSFAMHPDTRHGDAVSADFPGRLADVLAKVKGPEMVTVFATGACGDVNHVNVDVRVAQISPKESARLGMILAGEVLKAYGRVQPVGGDVVLRVRREAVSLPLYAIQTGELERSREIAANPPAATARVSIEHVHALKVLDVASREGKPIETEVQVIALGDGTGANDAAWVAIPGELFAELGLEIKRRSPFKHTIVVTLANGSIGYIPTKRAFAEGNYEPATARCAAGAGEQIVETAVRLLQK